MKVRALLLLLLPLFAMEPSRLAAAEEGFLNQQAHLAWQERAKPGQTEQAIQIWEQALKAEPGRADILISLTKACGRAYRHAAAKRDKQRWADQARAYGAQAVAKAPQNSDAYAAYGEALGQWAEAHKGLSSLKAVKQAVAALQKSVQLKPKNYYAHMLLSQFYTQAPGGLSVGDKKKGLEEARLAVQHGPQYAITHLALAKSLKATGHSEEAIQELKMILTLTPPPDAIPETEANKEDARQLLSEAGVSIDCSNASTSGGTACGP